MILDAHIHIGAGGDTPQAFSAKLQDAGVNGGLLISRPPSTFLPNRMAADSGERIREVLSLAGSGQELYPFYWIDPLEENASDQVAEAVEAGVAGFKVICDHFAPGDARAMEVFAHVAAAQRPLFFHSGILWDGKPSGEFNRPAAFEALLDIPGLRFSLAHIGWPWCDELIAVYGKFLNARSRRSDLTVEMFVDTTPGTPVIYRKEALTKLFVVGYDVAENVMFGSDCNARNYNAKWVREWVERDTAILHELGIAQSTIDGVFGGNLRRFVDVEAAAKKKNIPCPAE